MTPLTGPELLAKVKQLGDVSKSDLVRGCGYVSVTGSGKERLNFTAFYAALLEAKGLSILPGKKAPGRKLSYRTKVLSTGNVQVGAGYLQSLGIEPGTEFEIKLGRNGITLSLAQEAA